MVNTTTHTTEFFVKSYDEATDTFTVEVDSGLFDVDVIEVEGHTLPMIIGEMGEPDELVGRSYTREMQS